MLTTEDVRGPIYHHGEQSDPPSESRKGPAESKHRLIHSTCAKCVSLLVVDAVLGPLFDEIKSAFNDLVALNEGMLCMPSLFSHTNSDQNGPL